MNRREEFRKRLPSILQKADKDELTHYSIEAIKMGWYMYAYKIVRKYFDKNYEYGSLIDFSLGVIRSMMFFNMKRAYKRAKYKDTRRYILEIVGLNDKAYNLMLETFEEIKKDYPASYIFRHSIYRMFRGEIPDIPDKVESVTEIEICNLNLARGMAEMMRGDYTSAYNILYENLQASMDLGYDHTAMFVLRFLIPVVYNLNGKDTAMPLLKLGIDMSNETGNRWFFELFEMYRCYMEDTYTEYVEAKIPYYVDRWALIHELLARGYLHKKKGGHERRIRHIVDKHQHHHDLKVMQLFGLEV